MTNQTKRSPRKAQLLVILFVCLALLDAWAIHRLSSSAARAERSQQDLVEIRRIKQEIEAIRQAPKRAAAQEWKNEDLAKRIESAAGAAEIAKTSIFRISPQGNQRVEDTPYLENKTQVQLQQITIPQLMKFLHTLVSKDPEMQVSQLRLVAPREQELGPQWNVESTLSYLVYAPRSEGERRELP